MNPQAGKLQIMGMLNRTLQRVADDDFLTSSQADRMGDRIGFTDIQTHTAYDYTVHPARCVFLLSYVYASEDKRSRDIMAHLISNLQNMQVGPEVSKDSLKDYPGERKIFSIDEKGQPTFDREVSLANSLYPVFRCTHCGHGFDEPEHIGKKEKTMIPVCPMCHRVVKALKPDIGGKP